MNTLGEIEELAKGYSGALKVLDERLARLRDETDQIKKRLLPGILSQADDARGRKELIKSAIEESPELFVKPRTITMFGIRLGFIKQRGGLKWADRDQVVSLIEKHFPEQAEVLIKTKKSPVKDALNTLSAQDLKRIGVTVVEAEDATVVNSVESEAEKLVDALINENMPRVEEE